jgi:hypothetical protein
MRGSAPQICHDHHFLRPDQERTLLPSLPSLRKRIREALADGRTWVFIRHHAQQRMRERRVSRVDVQSILKRGSVIEDQSEGGVMRVLQEGRDLDGRRIRLVVELRDDEPRLDVVTVIAD